MSLFTRLNVVNTDATLPVVSPNDVKYLSGLEESAYEHWMFNGGDANTLVGRVNGIPLTPQSALPVYSNNRLSISSVVGESLLTGLTGTEAASGGGFTLFTVLKTPVARGGNPIQLFGNFGEGSGVMLSVRGWTAEEGWELTVWGHEVNINVQPSTWLFVGASIDAVGGNARLLISPSQKVESTGNSFGLSGEFALGNRAYDGGSVATLEIAEAGIIKTPYTLPELEELYVRSKARMASVGIPVE